VANYTLDGEWQRQTRALRSVLRGDFDHVWLLADSLNVERVAAAGFDGIAVYDPRVGPKRYLAAARDATAYGLVFSFNVNPGFHVVRPRAPVVDDCGQAVPHPPFVPASEGLDLGSAAGRESAARLAARRIADSFAVTIALQSDPGLANAQRGFFPAYVNSFNEWHEGTVFEPMKDAAALDAEEKASGYDNPERGDYRLALLKELLRS
jgi:hypothetical protein